MSSEAVALREAFNRVGDSIETTAATNPVNSWMRATSRREILAVCPPGSALLEIGCGAGADAVFLAEHGYRIEALDISDGMVQAARERVRSEGLQSCVHLWRGRLSEVASDLERSGWYPFDGAYANFSLTYEDSLRSLAGTVHDLLRPGAPFVFTLPNKLCLSEPLIAMARLRVRGVLSRFKEPQWARVRGMKVRFHAYTPVRVLRTLEGFFEPLGVVGVPVFMPPPFLYNPAFERLRANLEPFDDRLSARFPWRYLGDTTLFKVARV